MSETPIHEKPCAVPGSRHASYRYLGRYGYIMAAADTHMEAEREVRRSLSGPFEKGRLEVWNGTEYVPAVKLDNPPRA
jgi:hypothetical protein